MSPVTVYESYNPPLREEDILIFESLIGSRLPTEYRSFLLSHNGGRPEPNIFGIANDVIAGHNNSSVVNRLFGIHSGKHNNLPDYWRRFQGRVPANFLPVGNDPFGNLICLSLNETDLGQIYFWDHENEAEEGEAPTMENVYFIAHSFGEFMAQLTYSGEDER